MFLAYSRKHRRQSWSPYLRMIPWLLPHTRLWEGCEGNVRRVSRLRFARCVCARSQTSGRKTLGRPKRREFSSGWWRREEGPEKVEATPNHATTTSSAAPKVLPRRSSRKSSSAAAACARARTSKGPSTKPPPKNPSWCWWSLTKDAIRDRTSSGASSTRSGVPWLCVA